MSEIGLGQRMNLINDIRRILLPRPNQPRFFSLQMSSAIFSGSYLIVMAKIINSGNTLVPRPVLFPRSFYVIHNLE